MSEKIAGHLLVECLVAQGATHAFGVPGESFLAALDGFHLHEDAIQFVICRQEGGAAFMAEAHGKLTGRPGVCFVTRGPGATNASIGVHTAFQDSTPMVLFMGDVASEARDREAFQEVDFCSFFGPSTKGMAKRVERIDDARRIPEYVARAFATAMNGRPGPVVLVLPEDMLAQALPVDPALHPLPRVEAVQPGCDAALVLALGELLRASRRPLVDVDARMPCRLRSQSAATGLAGRHRHGGHRGVAAKALAGRRGIDQWGWQLCQLNAPLLPSPWPGKGPQDPARAHRRCHGLWRPGGYCRGHHHRPSRVDDGR